MDGTFMYSRRVAPCLFLEVWPERPQHIGGSAQWTPGCSLAACRAVPPPLPAVLPPGQLLGLSLWPLWG